MGDVFIYAFARMAINYWSRESYFETLVFINLAAVLTVGSKLAVDITTTKGSVSNSDSFKNIHQCVSKGNESFKQMFKTEHEQGQRNLFENRN